jgi:hypothetical protein
MYLLEACSVRSTAGSRIDAAAEYTHKVDRTQAPILSTNDNSLI